jgi:tripartite-type tricarboxylate transporter receptor subunit TctC
VVARLEAETLKAVRHPEIAEKLKELGAIPAPMNAAELDRFWKGEMTYWRDALRAANITIE